MALLCRLSKTYAPLLGRILLAFIFLQSGIEKLLNYDQTLGLMASCGMPEPQVLLPFAIAVLLIGGVMVLIGWQVHWGAAALIVFMLVATYFFHAYWAYPEAQQLNQFHHFVKNLAIIGALFLLLGMGSGPLSVDGGNET